MSSKHIKKINLSLNADKQRNMYIRHSNTNEQERIRLKREIENYFLEINKFTQYKTNNNNSIFIGKVVQQYPLPFLCNFHSVEHKGKNAINGNVKRKRRNYCFPIERARSCEVFGGLNERGKVIKKRKDKDKEWEWLSQKNEWNWNRNRTIWSRGESVIKIIENKYIQEKMKIKYRY